MSNHRAPKLGFPNASELGGILRITPPLTVGILAQVAIGITDSMMLGRLGVDAPGAEWLKRTLFRPVFPDPWEIRHRM